MSRRVVVIAIGVWLVIIAVAAELVAVRGSAQAPTQSRTFTADIDAAGLKSIDLRTTDGSVEVIGTDDDRIQISADVSTPGQKRKWMPTFAADLSRSELMGERRGSVYLAEMRIPGNDPVIEKWTVRVPRRFSVNLKANDGSFTITDVSGGVGVRATAGLGSKPGDVRVTVPGGPIDVSLAVGDIHAETTSTSRGPVDVQASVGDAHLTVAGRTIVSPREPGPGHRIRMTDAGPDAIKVHVGVGTAHVDIK